MGKIMKTNQFIQIARLLILALVTTLLTLPSAQPSHATHPQTLLLNNLQVKDQYGLNASDSAFLEIFPAFHPYEFEYYMYIDDENFNFVDFELDLPSDVYLDQTLQVTCTQMGLNAPSTYPFPNPVDLRLSESMMVNTCGGSPNPTGSATVTFKLYDLNDWQSMVPGLLPDSTYKINIIRKLGTDIFNFGFSIQDDNGVYSPNGPAIVSKRKWQIFPSGDGYTKSGFVFNGWKDQETNQVYQPGEPFLMDRSFIVRANWLEDVPNGSITIEGTTVPIGDEPFSFLAVDGQNDDYLNYYVTATGNYRVEMFTFQNYDEYLGDSSYSSAVFDSDTYGYFNASPTELYYDQNCQPGSGYYNCNVLILAVEIQSPSGNDSEFKLIALMVRNDGPGEYCANFYNTEAPSTSEPVEVCSASQGWVALPGFTQISQWDDESVPPDQRFLAYSDPDSEQSFFMKDYLISSSQSILPIYAGYFPLFETEDFIGQWLLDQAPLPLSINLFGNVFRPELCDELNPPEGEIPVQELCLVQTLDGDISSSQEIVHRAVAGNYYVALEFLPNDPSFPSSYSITADVTGAHYAQLDVEGLVGLVGSPDEFFYDDLNYGESELSILPTDFSTCPVGFCNSIYSITVRTVSPTDYRDEQINISVIRVDDSDTASYSLTFDANGGDGTPPATISGARGWVGAPSTNGLTKDGSLPLGWAVDSGGNPPWYTINKIPLVESGTLYARWLDAIEVNFYKYASDSQPYLSLEQLWGWFEGPVVNPTSSGQVFVGWSNTPDGSQIVDLTDFFIATDTNLYAVWSTSQTVVSNSNSGNQTVSTRPTPVSNTPNNPVVTTPETKPRRTSFAIQRVNGRTLLNATVPAKYANQNATIEVKRWIRGKVRYFVIGKTRSVLEASNSASAKLAFNFKLQLRPTDTFRIKVGPTEVIKAKAGK